MQDIKEVVSDMVEAGEPPEMIEAVVEKHFSMSAPEQGGMTQDDIHRTRAGSGVSMPPETWGEVFTQSKPSIRPGLNFVGQLGGELLGGGVGLLGGPYAPATIPTGVVVGGAHGYYGSNELADYILDEDKANYQDDILMGLATSAGGIGIAKAGSKMLGLGSKLFAPAEKRVGKMMLKYIKDPELFLKNSDELLELQKEIPGLKFTMEQGKHEPVLDSVVANVKNSGNAEVILAREEIDAHNNKLILDHFKSLFPEMSEGIADTIGVVQRVSNETRKGVLASTDDLRILAERLKDTEVGEDLGRFFYDELVKQKGLHKAEVKALWEELPDVATGNWKATAEKVVDFIEYKLSHSTSKADLPMAAYETMKRALASGDEIMVSGFRENASNIGQTAWDARGTLLGKNSREIKNIIDDEIATVSGDLYGDAKKAYAAYKAKFGNKAIGKILDYDSTVKISDIPRKFFNSKNPEVVAPLVNALGKDTSKELIRKQGLAELYAGLRTTGGELTEKNLSQFARKNKAVLDKFELFDEFNDLSLVGRRLEKAVEKDKSFQQSLAGKLLGKDVGTEIESLFANGATKEAVTSSLLKSLGKFKGNVPAIKGFKSGVMKHIMKGAKGVDDLMPLMEKYEPVLKILYGEKALKANRTFRKAYDVFTKTPEYAKMAAGGGSGIGINVVNSIAPFMTSGMAQVAGLRNMMHVALKLSKGNVDDVIVKMVFDPEYATNILSKAAEAAKYEAIGRPYDYFKAMGVVPATVGAEHLLKEDEEQ